MSIEKDYQKLKEYEKELTEIIERTNYQEKDIETQKNWDDLLYTEEEIRLYMKESPAPFNSETIFTTSEEVEEQNEKITDFRTSIPSSRRFPGYEVPQVRYAYSSPANYKSTRTERDDTKKPGVLYRDLECDDETETLQEQSVPVLTKKLTPPKQNN